MEDQKRRPEKKVDKVISGKAKKTKRNAVEKFTDAFVEEDIKTVKSYVLTSVILPGIKDVVADTLTNAINMILFGDTRSPRKSGRGHTNYSGFYRGERMSTIEKERNNARKNRNRYAYEEVCCENHGDAVDILDSMFEIIDQYGVISVMDLYDLAGMDSEFTDQNYGWSDISSATIVRRSANEHVIKMPKPMPIN